MVGRKVGGELLEVEVERRVGFSEEEGVRFEGMGEILRVERRRDGKRRVLGSEGVGSILRWMKVRRVRVGRLGGDGDEEVRLLKRMRRLYVLVVVGSR